MRELYKTSVVYDSNWQAIQRYQVVVNQGGTSSGKTYSIMQVLFRLAIENKGWPITVVGQDMPNLKKGAIRDAATIVYGQGDDVLPSLVLQEHIKQYNKSDHTYHFHNGSLIEFTSFENEQDARSGKRKVVFLNEANGIGLSIWDQLWMRSEYAFIDYNPSARFWVYPEIIEKQAAIPESERWATLIISDHRHNPFLTKQRHDKIENDPDPEHKKVYARGRTGKIEGLIYTKWKLVPSIPEGAKYIGTGLDFGFVNDVTAIVEVFMLDGELWLNELLYCTGLTNVPVHGAAVQHPNISDNLKDMRFNKSREITADSAEQKSISELNSAGWYVVGAEKGPGSVNAGIEILQRYKLNITQRSANLRIEVQHYMWKKAKDEAQIKDGELTNDGKMSNEPIDRFNHCLDAIRYVALRHLNGSSQGESYDVMV